MSLSERLDIVAVETCVCLKLRGIFDSSQMSLNSLWSVSTRFHLEDVVINPDALRYVKCLWSLRSSELENLTDEEMVGGQSQ